MKNTIVFAALAVAFGVTHVGQAANTSKANQSSVFVMTNAADKNQILSFTRQSDGTLKPYGTFATGGRGSGGVTDPLGSQGSLTLSDDHALLFAVNAGSGEVSSFRVDGPKLQLADVKPTGGSAPVAVAQYGDLVYVVNFAGNSNVSGFKVDDGIMQPIPNSIRYLTSANSGASSLAFSLDGKYLVVTEKLNNNIDVFPVQPDGTLGTVVTTKDPNAGLFEVAFAPDGALIALHAASGTISSFLVESTGALTPLTGSLPTVGGASCWFAITPNGSFLYTSNAASSNLSGFALSGAGLLTALPAGIVGAYPAGSANLDIAISSDNKYVYTLNSGTGSIGIEAIQQDGTLKLIAIVPVLTAMTGQNGIAAL